MLRAGVDLVASDMVRHMFNRYHVQLMAASAAEEVAKDEKYLAAVEKVGSDFIPLVVEFGHLLL